MAKEVTESQSTEVARIPERAVTIMDNLGIRLADPEQIQWRIAERLATATSLDELLDNDGPAGLRNHLGEPFVIVGVDYLPGGYESGPGFYALIHGVNKDGEPVLYTSGAMNVLIQVARGMSQGWFDGVTVKAEEADRPTADGFRPYRLVRA